MRTQKGSHCLEFAAALTLVVLFILLPLMNASVIVIRWVLANELVSAAVRELACCDTFRESWMTAYSEPSLANQIERIGGIKVEAIDLHLRITRVRPSNVPNSEDFVEVRRPGEVPADWLPGGGKTPATYFLVLKTKLEIAPLWKNDSGIAHIPGLTGGVPIGITTMHKWENLGRSPVSGQFFLNETTMR